MTAIVITGMAAMRPGLAVTGDGDDLSLAHRITDFDAQAMFGRKATRFSCRTTQLTMAACEAAIASAGLKVPGEGHDAIGLTIGTTVGSLSGLVDFGGPSFDKAKPYLVNAASFPNLALNTPAGAMAIRLGARGPNSTVVGGPLSGITAFRHAEITLRAGHAESLLTGAVEEVTLPSVLWAQSIRPTAVPGEGVAVFLLERGEVAEAAGRTPIAQICATVVRATNPADAVAIAGMVSEVLDHSGLPPDVVDLVALRTTGVQAVDDAQQTAMRSLFMAPLLYSEDETGDCYSAHSALQLAQVIDHIAGTRRAGVVIAADSDGAVGVIVVTSATSCQPPLEKEA